MAMTKKEKEQVAELDRKIQLLSLTQMPPWLGPDIPAPKSGHHTTGWIVYPSGRVSYIYSTAAAHFDVPVGGGASKGSGRQGGVALYSSLDRALNDSRALCLSSAVDNYRSYEREARSIAAQGGAE